MKTVNIIANYSSLYAGNFIPSLLSLAKDLKNKCNVVFSFPNRARERFWCQKIEENGFKVCFFGDHLIRDLKRINKEQHSDVLYTHFLSTPIVKLLSPISHKTKLIIHVHSDFSGGDQRRSLNKRFKTLVFGRILRSDTKYIYVSKDLMIHEKTKNSYYVRNAISVNRIISETFNANEFKVKHAYKKEKMHFLMFGWSPYIKGVDIVINTFNSLSENIKKMVQLTIVHNFNKKDEFQQFVYEKCEKINFDLISCNPTEDVFGLFKLHDVFISASRSEGFSYSVLEAIYSGLSVLVSDIPGTSWSTNYGATSFSNEDDLAKKIQEFVANPKQNKKIDQSLINDFSIEEWSKKISSIICEE